MYSLDCRCCKKPAQAYSKLEIGLPLSVLVLSVLLMVSAGAYGIVKRDKLKTVADSVICSFGQTADALQKSIQYGSLGSSALPICVVYNYLQ